MAAFRAQEAEKELQKQSERNAKVNRIATLERALEDDPEATPCPNFKRKLRRTEAYLETVATEASKGSEEGSQATAQDFEPPSGDDVATESVGEIELNTPPKKKKKVNETVRAAIKAARSSQGTAKEGPAKELLAGSHGAGKELPHGGCVSASAHIINDGGQIKATNVLR
jgi:hypothetical protein